MLRYVEMCDMQMQDGAKIDWEGTSNVFHTIADAAGRPHITYHEFLALCRALANYYKISYHNAIQRSLNTFEYCQIKLSLLFMAMHGYSLLFMDYLSWHCRGMSFSQFHGSVAL